MILLEDFAALVGLVFALFGVGLTLITRNGYFDVIGTAAIGVLLVLVAITLAVETKSLLLGEAASLDAVHKIEAALAGSPGVERIIHMKTLHLGPEEVLVAAKIAVGSSTSASEVADTINTAEINIRAAEPMVTALYLEPDIYDPNYVPRRPARAARQPPATDVPLQLAVALRTDELLAGGSPRLGCTSWIFALPTCPWPNSAARRSAWPSMRCRA